MGLCFQSMSSLYHAINNLLIRNICQEQTFTESRQEKYLKNHIKYIWALARQCKSKLVKYLPTNDQESTNKSLDISDLDNLR